MGVRRLSVILRRAWLWGEALGIPSSGEVGEAPEGHRAPTSRQPTPPQEEEGQEESVERGDQNHCMAPFPRLLLLLLLAEGVASLGFGDGWVPVRSAEALAAADTARAAIVKLANDRLIFSDGAMARKVVSAAHFPATNVRPERYYLVLDMDVNGENKVVQIEGYKDGDEWKIVLPVPAKNLKSSSPESLTSPRDLWSEAAASERLVQDAATNMDATLQGSVFEVTASGRPELLGIVHAEVRRRDLGVEKQHLQDMQQAQTAHSSECAAHIAALEQTLVSTMSAKVLALETLAATNPAVVKLDQDIAATEDQLMNKREERDLASRMAALAGDGVTLIANEIAKQAGEAIAGSSVADARSYVFLVMQYQTRQNFIAVPFRKQVLGYKDENGAWKMIGQEDFVF